MQLLLVAACVVLVAHVSEGFGFGGGSSCGGCQAPAPAPCAPPPVQNQCCSAPPQAPRCGCKTRRRFTQRRQIRDVTHQTTHINDSTEDDPRCNSKELREIILDNISSDADQSKMAIHEVANIKLGGHYAVICSAHEFTYIADSRVYCLDGNAALNCYVFQI